MCYVYGFDLLEKLCVVSMVVVLVVPCLFGCVVSTIHTVPHYIPFCMYHLPKWHMVWDHLKALLAHHGSSVTFFPLTLAFFYSAVIKSSIIRFANRCRNAPAILLTSSLSLVFQSPDQPSVCETCRSLSLRF